MTGNVTKPTYTFAVAVGPDDVSVAKAELRRITNWVGEIGQRGLRKRILYFNAEFQTQLEFEKWRIANVPYSDSVEVSVRNLDDPTFEG